ncbi:MAG TPA: hypothetical protein ENK05_14135 [Gammaproteobacteria bacterium]|nr:hypothetical protein [Gammaproteobacteria bacterium]
MDGLQIDPYLFFGVLEATIALLLLALFLYLRGRSLAARVARLQKRLVDARRSSGAASAPAVTGDETAPEPAAAVEGEGDAAATHEAAEAVDESPKIDTRDAEIGHLRAVIDNQQDTMKALRAQLEQQEFEGLAEILQQLDEFERQGVELERCLLVLEQENIRLKAARASGDGVDAASLEGERLDDLQSMVGQQQQTIDSLRNMIRELAPEAGKARELENAMEGIQSANRELKGCVAVLEDENALLRSELEQIQGRLASGDGRDEADPRREVLEARVQELEALVAFKDSAIEEAERRYQQLEAEYKALTASEKAG